MGTADEAIKQILENLSGCGQTTDGERRELESLIEHVTRGHSGGDLIDKVMSEISRWAAMNRKYFRGSPAALHQTDRVWHTKRETRFRAGLALSISLRSKGSEERARREADEIMAELKASDRWHLAVGRHGGVALHRAGTPFWIADPESGRPHPSLEKPYYPARAGIGPDIDRRYVLLQLNITGDARVPRFADSNGYPYWRPGGKTQPIADCPAALSGFDEAVTDEVTLGCVAAEPHFFNRSA